MSETNNSIGGGLVCPVPLQKYRQVLLAHGSGGTLGNQLIREMIVPAFGNSFLEPLHDGALLQVGDQRIAFTTDSYVIDPIFFPGGDIGRLAVNGTVNDLAMCGARPVWLSAGFIIEEGFSMEELARIVASMKSAAADAGVVIVTGDTKVVDRGKGDKIYINTAGIGFVPPTVDVSPKRAAPGDVVILNGSIGLHGIAIMSVREGLQFERVMESDCAPLNKLVDAIVAVTPDVHVLRDPTRGGVASALNEIAQSSGTGIEIDECSIPISAEVRAACELLGLDPLYVANEGKCLVIVSPTEAETVVATMKKNPLGKDAVVIGTVVAGHPGRVVMKTSVGGERIVDMISGEQLPRIC